jgi:hypothetical protein
MARRLRTREISRGTYDFFSMPQLDAAFKPCYDACFPGHPDLRTEFPSNGDKTVRKHEPTQIKDFRYEPRDDAEAVFWLLLYWFMQARPAGTMDDKDELESDHWNTFTGGHEGSDPRTAFVDRFPSQIFHHKYKDFEPLFRDMTDILQGDPDVLDVDVDRKNKEYLIVALQRLLLNFLVKHRESRFMKIMKDGELRKIRRHVRILQGLTKTTTTSTPKSQSRGSNPLLSHSMETRSSGMHKRRRESDGAKLRRLELELEQEPEQEPAQKKVR